MLAGNFVGRLMAGLGVGMLLAALFRRLKEGKSNGFMFHYLYWFGFWMGGRSVTIKNPFRRHFLP